jgi:hypothetical protein
MPRLPLHASVSFAVLAILVSPAKGAAEEQTWNREFTVAHQPTIRIDTDDASVKVHSWNDSKVRAVIKYRKTTGGLVLGRQGPRVELNQAGDAVSIVARIEGSVTVAFFDNSRLDVEVWLPRESDLVVSTEDGPVRIEDVAGHLDFRTQDGPLIGRGLRGEIRARSQDGNVQLDDVDGSLSLATQDATSEISGRFDRLDVASADGGIEIDVRPGSKLREAWSVRSQDGSIHLRIPNHLAATIDARTRDGNLSIDLPVLVQGSIRHNELVGDLNGGGPILKLRSSDGSIRVTTIE